MEEHVKGWLQGTEFLIATEQYSLYINKGNKTLHIFNGEDVWEITLNELGDLGFK